MSKKLADTQPMVKRLFLQGAIDTQATPEFREKGLSMRITDTLRTAQEQYELTRSGKSKTMDSYHLNGLAIDATVVKKEGIIPFKWFWNKSKYYDIYNDKMVDAGFRSLGKTWSWDYYHVEYPVIFQGQKPYCFAYVILNALQGMKRSWRIESKAKCYKIAEKLYNELLERKMPRHVESACKLAKEFRLIEKYESLEYRDISKANDNVRQTMQNLLDRGYGVVVSQSGKPFGTKDKRIRDKIRRERLKQGRGIAGHTMCVAYVDLEGIHCVNSHKTNPQVTISWKHAEKVIQKIHVLHP